MGATLQLIHDRTYSTVTLPQYKHRYINAGEQTQHQDYYEVLDAMLRDGDGLWVVRGAHSTGSSLVLLINTMPVGAVRSLGVVQYGAACRLNFYQFYN